MEQLWSEISGICRLCLCEGDEVLIPASKILECPTAVEDIERCTGIRIVKETNIPYSICEDCSSKLEMFTTFRSFCLSNDALFRKWYPMVFKPEPSDTTAPEEQEALLDKSRNEITDHIGYIAWHKELSPEDNVENNVEYLEIDDSVSVVSRNDSASSVNGGDLEIYEEAKEDSKLDILTDDDDDAVQENQELPSKAETRTPDYVKSHKRSAEPQSTVGTSKTPQPGSEKSPHKVSQKQLCPICGKMVYDLSDHKLSHSNERKYACPHCSMAYGRKAYLKFHVRSVHQKKVVKTCEICNRDFAYKTGYDAHMRAQHNIGKWYECKPCGMQFRHPGGLRAHNNRKHNDESNCECPVCGMGFLDKMALRNHSRVHSSEKMFACKYCPKRFRSPNAHRGHELTHLGITFPCPHCPKSYRYKQNLKIHLSKHYT